MLRPQSLQSNQYIVWLVYNDISVCRAVEKTDVWSDNEIPETQMPHSSMSGTLSMTRNYDFQMADTLAIMETFEKSMTPSNCVQVRLQCQKLTLRLRTWSLSNDIRQNGWLPRMIMVNNLPDNIKSTLILRSAHKRWSHTLMTSIYST